MQSAGIFFILYKQQHIYETVALLNNIIYLFIMKMCDHYLDNMVT